MTRRIPIFASLIVVVAVALMVGLGLWQLQRMHWKESLLAHYAAAQRDPVVVPWTAKGVGEDLLYRRAHLTCVSVGTRSSIAGHNAKGDAGVVQTVRCALPGGGDALVVLGWSRQPNAATDWKGGEVAGIIAPGPRLVADPPLAGLEPSAAPDPAEIPNNHFSYAVQWFLFAGTALVIYALALLRRK